MKPVESFLVCQGSMLQVSPHFLEQTLDKKLMSDLRVSNWSLFTRDLLFYSQSMNKIRTSTPLTAFSSPLCLSRGSVRPMNGPRTSLLLESSPLAESGLTTPPRRNWTQTLLTSSPQVPAVPLCTAWRTRCLVCETWCCMSLFLSKEFRSRCKQSPKHTHDVQLTQSQGVTDVVFWSTV